MQANGDVIAPAGQRKRWRGYRGRMSPLVRATAGFAGVAAGIGVALAVMIPRSAPPPPIVVTTDTELFCHQLSGKLRDLMRLAPRPPEAEIVSLGDEGRHLCDIGQVRGGIQRLRRGLTLMMHDLDERGEP